MVKKQQIPDHKMNFTGTVSQALDENVDTNGTPTDTAASELLENVTPTNKTTPSSQKDDLTIL